MVVSIGEVSKVVKVPQNPEYVPRKYCKSNNYITSFILEET